MKKVRELIASLQAYESLPGVFNPWRDIDPNYDLTPAAPKIRSQHLERYLQYRVPYARFILLAEAVGYQGGRFSGIAMTSERILLGHHPTIDPAWVAPGGGFSRTSRPELRRLGFNEPTATIVWTAVHELGISPFEVILWNTFPFHPYRPDQGALTNRTPTREELALGQSYLSALLALCPQAMVIAIGKKAEATLTALNIPCTPVRHPANGGATAFRLGLRRIQNLRVAHGDYR
ncbi:MAG: uracil-DNA glycosylase [bacterium]